MSFKDTFTKAWVTPFHAECCIRMTSRKGCSDTTTPRSTISLVAPGSQKGPKCLLVDEVIVTIAVPWTCSMIYNAIFPGQAQVEKDSSDFRESSEPGFPFQEQVRE